ncbi:fatty acid--CoA ligase [Streptomyces sp. NRRL F-2664]|uniref:fatty acid--CoA ligase n=1 Tax=Streptomyces sp. NRRL F-2664 TaxID=1463842 RepID=UPI0004C85B1A|nr:fatty acid--CoA ligase [Streptomyces sp. NRRL F-2664]
MYHPQLQTLDRTVAFHAAERPDRTAVVCEGREVGYGELHRRSNRTARALHSAGAVRGSRVAYLGKESEHYYDILFGCAKAGTVLVPINWRLTAPEVDHILRDSGTALLFVEDEFLDVARKAAAELSTPVRIVALDGPAGPGTGFTAWQAGHSGADPESAADPDDPVAQIYTSGTTGLPKGVVLAHRSFFKVRDALASEGLAWIDWHEDDVSLIGIPGFHIGGLWWATQGFNAGVTNVAMRMFVSGEAVRLIRGHGVTTTCLVPAMLQMMLAEPGAGRADFATLRKIVYGGSPISESLLQECLERIGCEFAQIYGLTETGNTAVCLPPHEHVAGGSRLKAAGRPYPGFGAKVVDRAGRELPTGAVGEVCLRTPSRMLSYWGLPEATAETLVDGWIHTGDAGYLDEGGYVFLCDRIKDTIIVAGENVYPAEIENALARHPSVVEAAVVGVPDERWGEAVHAFVVVRPGHEVTPRQLVLSLKGTLADFKIPSGFEFIETLPRNPSGKILRRELRDRFWQDRERRVN